MREYKESWSQVFHLATKRKLLRYLWLFKLVEESKRNESVWLREYSTFIETLTELNCRYELSRFVLEKDFILKYLLV